MFHHKINIAKSRISLCCFSNKEIQTNGILHKPQKRTAFFYNSERYCQLHLESLLTVYCVRDILGHDQSLALFHVEYFAAYGESTLAFQNGYHSITACCMGGDFLALVKGKIVILT